MLAGWRTAVEQTLDEQLAAVANPHLRAAMVYSVEAGGKRLRPLLLLSVVAMYDGVIADALPAAAALEYVHTYSLIHDDLPAMDDDDLRRGKPTNHKQFGEALAILAGDALLTDAFAILSRQYPEKGAACVQILAEAAGSNGMVGGQVLDMDGENEQYHLETLKRMHEAKTGALIQAAIAMGGLFVTIPETDQTALADFSAAFGLGFQIKDDINDVTKTTAELGKTADKDVIEHKNTFPELLGLDGAIQALQVEIAKAETALNELTVDAAPLAEILAVLKA
ncbi:Octaprenyl-diphosphate synthase [Lacticaseibacillus paracasei subsp. paracasei Lpp120]|jgi:geranylgeranyl diphosphate synthase type II|nr:polyprenyl synthetase [Lacticaseibacillus paracasei]EKQ21415.1 polyprenyl synthetase [Lacticaseibacillus casei UW4]EPC30714.1 Octaprenyl-diphosphate synthase [Lacticaseibacillus paracasei subsp. paracasei Lpp22]EPC32023.1 Octaprenyl-diphosphate synthase [Lacticaseibacillus paracasei subsp. paracasei Lpp120]GAN42857.1 geranyltranstransferase [Lacticaseibacillus paracasei NRIC 1981]